MFEVNLAIITTVTASTAIVAPEDVTQEAWAPHLGVTAASSPDGAHHQEPTQTPLPSDGEPGQGTMSPMDTPRDGVLHRTTASVTQTGNGSLLMGPSKNNGPYSFLMSGVKWGIISSEDDSFHYLSHPGDLHS